MTDVSPTRLYLGNLPREGQCLHTTSQVVSAESLGTRKL
jgi:hypothetical protein